MPDARVDKSIVVTLLKQHLYTDALYSHRLNFYKHSKNYCIGLCFCCNTENYAQATYQLFPHQAESQQI